MESAFDYKIIARCEYGVYAGYDNEVLVVCGEPAIHKVWWKDDAPDTIFVCPEHFECIWKTDKGR